MGEVECEHCGGEIGGSKPWRRKYCSRKCANKSKTRETTVSTCPNCGDTFEHHKSQDRTFCQRGCANQYHHSGEKSPHYVDGRHDGRPYGPNWSKQRRLALKRDFHQCRMCRMTQEQCYDEYGRELNVHHRTPRRKFESLKKANRLRNLITLCPRCHMYVENDES